MSPAELRAMKDVGAIALLGSICGATDFDMLYKTGCEHKESGLQLQIPPLQGQMKDPRQDPDYDFYFQTSKRPQGGLAAEIAYDPKRSGLAGVFTDGVKTYCNSLGRASARPELLMSQTEINEAVDRLKGASGKGQP